MKTTTPEERILENWEKYNKNEPENVRKAFLAQSLKTYRKEVIEEEEKRRDNAEKEVHFLKELLTQEQMAKYADWMFKEYAPKN